MKKKIISLSIASLCLPLYAEANNATEHHDNDTIIVFGSTENKEIDSINSKNIEKHQPETVGKVLKMVPGVQAGHPTGLGQRFKIRGLDDQYLSISVDGARQNGYAFHHSGNYGIDSELLKKIDVSLGNNNIMYDIGSLGGSLKFRTVNAEDLLENGELFGFKTKLGYSSNGNEFQKSLSMYGKTDKLSGLAFINHKDLNDLKSGSRGYGTETIPNNGELLNYLLKTKLELTDEQNITLSKEHYKNDAETNFRINFGDDVNEGRLAKSKQLRDTYTITYSYVPIDNRLINMEVTAYDTKQTSTHMRTNKTPGFDTTVKTQGVKANNSSEFETRVLDHTLTIGSEFLKSSMLYNDPDEHIYNSGVESYKSGAIYTEDSINIGNFTITPGIRYDFHKYNSYQKNNTEFNKSYVNFSKALSLQYELTENNTLYANYTELFKGASGKELGMGRSNNNLNIKSTKGTNIEGGIISTYRNIGSDNDMARFKINLYETKFNDFIAVQNRTLTNIPKAKIQGIEAQIQYLNKNISSRLGYAKTTNKITKGGDDFSNGLPFVQTLGDSLTLDLEYNFLHSDISIGLSSELRLKNKSHVQSRSGTTEIKKPSYFVSDAFIQWAPTEGALKNTSFNIGVDNIFDKYYTDHSYYLSSYQGQSERGRNYKLSVSYKF